MPRKKDPNKMICTSIQMPPRMVAELQVLADHTGRTVSALIRRAVSDYLVMETIDRGRWKDGQ